jgi:digeranylgeranylglycerophospholipid reductase
MTQTFHSDVLIVGAGPIGAYLGWKLAETGCSVQVLEVKSLEDLGTPIEIIHLDQVRFDEFEIPLPTSPELIHLVPTSKVWSVDGKDFFTVHYPVVVVTMPAYLQRLHGYLRKAGGQIEDHTRVEGVIIENGFLKGVYGTCKGEAFKAYAKITVDASGMASAVRRHLPDSFGVENTPVPPEQTFYCALELRDELPAGLPTGNNTFLGAPGFWNRSYGEGAVLGIIAPGSAEAAWAAHKAWREATYGNPGRLAARRIGSAPFRRPPYSLVGNGFLGAGDCVYQNKAFSGEGITSGYTACKIAKEILRTALQRGDFSQDSLWGYNRAYFTGQGAKFAGLMNFFPILTNLPKEDVDYLYRQGILISSADYDYLNNHYELDLPAERWSDICSQLETGVNQGKFSATSLQMLKNLFTLSTQLKNHYLEYPNSPQGLSTWREKAQGLWGY